MVVRSLFGDDAVILSDRDLQVLLLASILPPLGIAMVSPILDTLIDPFGTTPGDIGLMMSVYTAPGIVMIPVVGVLADRYGRKPVLVGALLLFGTAGAAIAGTTNYSLVLALRLLQGIGFAGLTPIVITSIGDIYAGDREATGQGVRFIASSLSSTAFPLITGALVLVAWQYPFVLFAMGIPIAVVVYIWFDEPTTDGGAPVANRGTNTTVGDQLRGLARILRQPDVLALVVGRSLPMFLWLGFLTYISIVVVRLLGGSPTEAGIIAALASVAYAAAGSQAERITAAFESRLYPLAVANVCMGVGFGVFLLAPVLPIAAIGVLLLGGGFGTLLSLYRSVVTGLAGRSQRGGIVSTAEALGRVTSTAAPLIIGGVITTFAAEFGLGPAIQVAGTVIAILTTIGGLACLFLVRGSTAI